MKNLTYLMTWVLLVAVAGACFLSTSPRQDQSASGIVKVKPVQSETLDADPLAALAQELSTPEGAAASFQRAETQRIVAFEAERLNQLQLAFRAQALAQASAKPN